MLYARWLSVALCTLVLASCLDGLDGGTPDNDASGLEDPRTGDESSVDERAAIDLSELEKLTPEDVRKTASSLGFRFRPYPSAVRQAAERIHRYTGSERDSLNYRIGDSWKVIRAERHGEWRSTILAEPGFYFVALSGSGETWSSSKYMALLENRKDLKHSKLTLIQCPKGNGVFARPATTPGYRGDDYATLISFEFEGEVATCLRAYPERIWIATANSGGWKVHLIEDRDEDQVPDTIREYVSSQSELLLGEEIPSAIAQLMFDPETGCLHLSNTVSSPRSRLFLPGDIDLSVTDSNQDGKPDHVRSKAINH